MPNTKIIGNFTKTINNFSKYGRLKNKVYKTLEKEGLSEFRERPISKGRSVIVGYTNNNHSITIGIDAAKGYIQKQSSHSKVLTFFNETRSTINRIYSDWSGKILKTSSNSIVFIDGVKRGSKIESVNSGKSKITKTTGIFKDLPNVSRKIDAEYANGSKYTCCENIDKTKTFAKEARGIKFSHTI